MSDFQMQISNKNTEFSVNLNSDYNSANWQIAEVMELFSMPFNDLIFKASNLHRQFHNPNQVQISTLLSIKTGGCPENC
ncbi:MAG: biotin synthase, partial [Alphaproteobacteria bacterium]